MFRLEEAIEKAKSVELPEAEYGSSKFSCSSVIEQRIRKWCFEQNPSNWMVSMKWNDISYTIINMCVYIILVIICIYIYVYVRLSYHVWGEIVLPLYDIYRWCFFDINSHIAHSKAFHTHNGWSNPRVDDGIPGNTGDMVSNLLNILDNVKVLPLDPQLIRSAWRNKSPQLPGIEVHTSFGYFGTGAATCNLQSRGQMQKFHKLDGFATE